MRWPAFALLVLYFACAFALPLAVVLWNSLLPFAQAPSAEALRSVSLRSYWMVLAEDPRVMQIALNTLVLIVSTASICMGLGTLAAWLIVRSSPRVSRAVALATFLPTAFPSIIIALALLLGAVGTPLYGTVMLIVLGQVIRHLPLATRVMNVAQAQVGRELEEASAAAGATWQQTLKHVIVPLLRSPFTHGWLWVAMLSLRDVSIPLLLLSLQNPVAASLMWEYWSWGKLPEASASAILLLFLALVVGVPAQWQLRRGHAGV
jgi:iron(III) transport system permease protein